MGCMRIHYDPEPNIVDETNNITAFDINSQNNVTALSISLTFYGVVPNCESLRGVHAKLQVNQLLRNNIHGRKIHLR